MIEFNLLPKDIRAARPKKASATQVTLPKVAPIPVIIGIIVVIIVSQIGLSITATMQRNRLAEISTQISAIADDEKIANILQSELNKLSRKFSVIDSLASGSLIWSKKLFDLSAGVTDGVWLRSLYLNTAELQNAAGVNPMAAAGYGAVPEQLARQVLVIEGSAVSPSSGEEAAVVGKFIESLRNSKEFFEDFEDIKLSSIQRKKLGEIESMDFSIECYFKSGRSYFEKLEARD